MKKKLFYSKIVLAALAVMCFSVFALSFNAGRAEAASDNNFFMQGASVRYEEQPSGLRFHAAIEINEFNSLSAATDFKTGILVIPAALLGEDALTIDKVAPGGAKNLDTTGKYFDETVNGVDYKVFKGYIYDIPVTEYKTALTAVAYVYCNGAYTYTAPVLRSITKVAQTACASADLDENVKESLYNEYIAPFAEETVNYTLTVYTQNADGSYGEPETLTKQALVNATVSAEEKAGYVRLGDYEGIAFVDGSTELVCRYAKSLGEFATEDGGVALDYGATGETVSATLKCSKGASSPVTSRITLKNYVYTEDEYSAGENFIAVEFKGANFPGQVLWGASELSADANAVYGFGVNFDRMDGSIFMKNATLNTTEQAVLVGTGSQAVKGGDYFNIQNLRTTYKDNEFVLVGGVYVDTVIAGRTGLKLYMYEKISDTELVLRDSIYYQQPDMEGQRTGKIYISGVWNGASINIDTVISVTRPDTLEGISAKLQEKYPDSNIWSSSCRVKSAQNEDGTLYTDIGQINLEGFGYVTSPDDYVSGEYVRLDFTGEFAPGQIVFGATPSGTKFQPIGIGFDLDLDTSNVKVCYKPDLETPINRQIVSVSGHLQRGYIRNTNIDKEIAVIARATQNGADVELEYYIYVKGESGYTLDEHKTAVAQNVTIPQGKVMITNSQTVAKNTTVNLYKAGTLSEISAGLPVA